MSQEILNRFQSSFAKDVVGVYDDNFNQVFKNAQPLKAIIKEPSKTMDHPLETGSVISDHRIILQVEVELFLILSSIDYISVYQQIRQLFLNATLLKVQTKVATYENQMISDPSHEETTEVQNGILMSLKLIETQLYKAEYSELEITPTNPSDKNTVTRGTIPPKDSSAANDEKSSLLYKLTR